MSPAARTDPVGVVLVYPDLLGTYGDSGNATILAQRLRWRGIPAEVHTVLSGDPVPETADVYVVGGGEDLPQALAARQLGAGSGSGPLNRAHEAGAAVFAVCAGLQILGTRFVGPDGVAAPGIGLLDVVSTQGHGPRAVGELVVEPDPGIGLPTLTGYENHAGVTTLGPAARPLGTVRTGMGNGPGAGTEGNGNRTGAARIDGALQGRVVATYLHGPALARNPALADHILASVVGPLDPLDDSAADELRTERLRAAAAGAAPSASPRRVTSRLPSQLTSRLPSRLTVGRG